MRSLRLQPLRLEWYRDVEGFAHVTEHARMLNIRDLVILTLPPSLEHGAKEQLGCFRRRDESCPSAIGCGGVKESGLAPLAGKEARRRGGAPALDPLDGRAIGGPAGGCHAPRVPGVGVTAVDTQCTRHTLAASEARGSAAGPVARIDSMRRMDLVERQCRPLRLATRW